MPFVEKKKIAVPNRADPHPPCPSLKFFFFLVATKPNGPSTPPKKKAKRAGPNVRRRIAARPRERERPNGPLERAWWTGRHELAPYTGGLSVKASLSLPRTRASPLSPLRYFPTLSLSLSAKHSSVLSLPGGPIRKAGIHASAMEPC